MKNNLGLVLLAVTFGVFAACQPTTETPMAGKVLVDGDYKDKPFMMATGPEFERFMAMNKAFNEMDIDAMFEHIADTVGMRGDDGSWSRLSKEDFAGYFSLMDSVKWDLWAVIPVQVEGSERVNIFADGREVRYFKDGTVWDKHLFERFIFVDGKLTGVRQWSAEVMESE